MRSYRSLPAIPTGYPLDDVWSVVVPIARTNLITNPSLEIATLGWVAIGASCPRSTAQQYHGAYSLAIIPTAATTDGAYYPVALTAGTLYAYSCKIMGSAGRTYKLTMETTGSVELASVTFTATGRWQWIWGYWTETSSTTRRFTVRKAGHTDTRTFYIDGAQVEAINAGETVSTYIDGDQQGLVPNQTPAAYYWNGTPHASTSTRSAQTRAGGMVVPFRKYGFLITTIIGLGMAGVQNIGTDYARIDGSYDDYTRKPSRQFTLTGRFQGRTYAELRRNRSGLAQLLDRDLTGQDQRLTLLRHVEDGYGRIRSSATRLLAKYESGFSSNTDNMHAENVPITFTLYMPNLLADGEDGEALNVQLSVSNANAIIKRDANGTWSALSTGMTSGATPDVDALAQGIDGKIYAGGTFTGAGASGADFIAAWDGTSWSVIGSATAMNDIVHALAVGPDGALYAGGRFTNAGGIAAADYIAKWDGSAWSALGTGGNAPVYALAFGADGTLYAGGEFTSMGGVANTAGIAKWNGSAWSAMGTGVAGLGSVNAIAVRGTVTYIGGTFTSVGGVANTNGMAKWSGSAWLSMGTAPNAAINAMSFAPNGLLYIGGAFTTINGQSIAYLAIWNGVAFTGGVTLDLPILAVAIEANGIGHIGGQFTTVNGITYPDRMARFFGNTALTPEDVDLPGAALVESFLTTADGSLYVGFAGNGTATAAGITTITNTGTAKTYPMLVIKGPSSGTARIYSLVNATTGRSIYMNLTISAGETCKLIFQPDNLSFTSDFQGNIASSILGGSNEADWFLSPGANSIAFLSASSTVTAVMNWRTAYASMDDVP